MRQLQKKIKTGTLNLNQDDPFELFIAATNIRYCYYNETHKILGNTYGMCVLQVSLSVLWLWISEYRACIYKTTCMCYVQWSTLCAQNHRR